MSIGVSFYVMTSICNECDCISVQHNKELHSISSPLLFFAVDTCAQPYSCPNFPQNHVIYSTGYLQVTKFMAHVAAICGTIRLTYICVLNDGQLNETLVVMGDIKYTPYTCTLSVCIYSQLPWFRVLVSSSADLACLASLAASSCLAFSCLHYMKHYIFTQLHSMMCINKLYRVNLTHIKTHDSQYVGSKELQMKQHHCVNST